MRRIIRAPFSTGPILGLLLLVVHTNTGGAAALEKIGPRLARAWERLAPEDHVTIWVHLRDKGASEPPKASVPLGVVSERSLRRRLKVRPASRIVDYTDLAIEPSYVEQVANRVIRVRQRSKWFNSVSVEATRAQILDLQALPWVRSLDLVARFGHARLGPGDRAPAERAPAAPENERGTAAPAGLDYGASFRQMQQIQVPALHALGLRGQDVLIGHFDTGYSLLDHEAFRSLRVLAAYDFVDHDPDPTPSPDDTVPADAHGMMTLSVLGGFRPGELIGPAYGASFLLARTELAAIEVPAEEDNWIAAAEWADSLGVDVISSSLKFLDYDPPFQSWTWLDMDGATTLVTRAADLAAARGILVVNGAGNEGGNPYHNTLVAPADGDSVVAVGAVEPNGARARFSSVGPTVNQPPRIKPDLMAPGTGIYVAGPGGTSSYETADGTSLSCPLVAGVAALLLGAHPEATPMRILEALRRTASNAGSPSNSMGWGVVDAQAALRFLDAGDSTAVEVEDLEAVAADGRALLSWRLRAPALRDLAGVLVQRAGDAAGPFVDRAGAPLAPSDFMSFEDRGFDPGRDYWYRLVLVGADGSRSIAGPVGVRPLDGRPASLALHQVFEPADGGPVQIRYSLGGPPARVGLSIFDARGRLVWRLDRGLREPGEHALAWQRRDAAGRRTPRGVYLVRLEAGGLAASRKLVLLHQ